MSLRSVAVLFFMLSALITHAQVKPTLPFALKGAVDSQFYYINTLSRNFDGDLKLIRRSNLDILKKNTLDTIQRLKSELSEIRTLSASSIETTAALRDSVSNLKVSLEEEMNRTDSISFLGIDFQKSTYHTVVWSIIAVLALGFFGLLFVFQKSKSDTIDHKKAVNELQDEFQTFKKKSMEKEQILRRQLLDEQLKRNS